MRQINLVTKEISVDELKLRNVIKITSEEALVVLRDLQNAMPGSERLRKCIEECTKTVSEEPESFVEIEESESITISDCNCSKFSSQSNLFCTAYVRKHIYKERHIRYFANILIERLNREIIEHINNAQTICYTRNKNKFFISPMSLHSTNVGDSTANVAATLSKSISISDSTSDRGCAFPYNPLIFRHFGKLLSLTSSRLNRSLEPFNLDYVMPCKSIGKWGAFLKLVDVILEKRDIRMRALTPSSQIQNTDDARSCCKDVCKIPARKHIFHDVNRFKDIELYAYSTLCLNLMKWSNCTTKRWKCIRSQSHLVIHLPSMSYPCWLRCIDRKKFTSLQNIQIGRIGWLVNKNANVLYIYPGKSNLKMKLNLYNFIANARPDVRLSRLWIIVNDFKNLHEDINSKYPSGCESLFYTPSVYHRVSYISSGCSGFIIPGVLSKTDLFIACELKTPIIGPCLKFQERLLNKEYVMSILAEANIKHPPYSKVKNLQDLCLRMAEMMTRLPWGFHRKWLLKLNYGFCSNQSAFIQLDPAECFKRMNELPYYLAHILPQKLIFQTESHMDHSDFFDRIKEYGAVLMCCPIVDFRTVSLGFFIEHDTAKASLRTTGDVIHMHNGSNCFTNDLGFIIPQTTLPDSMLQDLANRLGDLLVAELYIGFFGVDIVVFPGYDFNDNEILNYWVVDIDPYYTDLLSFDDWRRFCLDIPEPKCPNQKAQLDISPVDSNHRYVVCSGKLYIDGLFADNSINELCIKHKIAYSYKAKTGCMIHPIDIKEQTFLLFSFYRSKELALKYFVLALKALYYTSVNDKQLIQKNEKQDIINLARDMEIYYNIVD